MHSPKAKEILDLARTLINRLEVVETDPAYRAVWQCWQTHFGPYRGPTYTKEFLALKAALEKEQERRTAGRFAEGWKTRRAREREWVSRSRS